MSRRLFVPGRIELFGKHVDYGGGTSLTCAIDDGITAEVEPIDARVIEVQDRGSERRARVPLERDARPGDAYGGTYVAAVARRLTRDFGPLHRGVRIVTSSSLPQSAGLSSSGAFVTMLTFAVADANGLMERAEWKAHLGTRLALAEYCGAIEMGSPFGPWEGEHGVGTRGGAQDHVAIVCNVEGKVRAFRYLPAQLMGEAAFPMQWVILVAVSGVRATKTGGALADYNRAADLVRGLLARWNETTGRTDVSLATALESSPEAPMLVERLAQGSDDAPSQLARLTQFRRETEIIVPGALAAIAAADAVALGRWAVESQQGAEVALRNQVPETMFLARTAMTCGAHAASAFGAGFGGAVWAIADTAQGEAVLARWQQAYAQEFPARRARWMSIRPAAGLRWLDQDRV